MHLKDMIISKIPQKSSFSLYLIYIFVCACKKVSKTNSGGTVEMRKYTSTYRPPPPPLTPPKPLIQKGGGMIHMKRAFFSKAGGMNETVYVSFPHI